MTEKKKTKARKSTTRTIKYVNLNKKSMRDNQKRMLRKSHRRRKKSISIGKGASMKGVRMPRLQPGGRCGLSSNPFKGPHF